MIGSYLTHAAMIHNATQTTKGKTMPALSNTSALWTIDTCPTAEGNWSIRKSDGTQHGDTESEPIATVYDEAHAPLIAAAPEMLKALQLVVDSWYYSGNKTHEEAIVYMMEAVDHANEIITKATKG